MRKSIIYCDRCGRELQPSEKSYMLTTFIYGEDRESASDVCDGAELCETCYEAVDQAVAAAVQGVKEELKEAPAEKKRKLDLGKVEALRRAGWSQAKIADEMGVSIPTISKALKKIFGEETDDDAD